MARSVVLQGTKRCERCELPPRWCVCPTQHRLPCPLAIDVLQHVLEAHRPSSTGNLIPRVLEGVRLLPYQRQNPPTRADVLRPGAGELWILHPNGEPPPALEPANPPPQILLLDAAWAQASGMLAHVQGWGRRVRLPMTGPSRYALRAQNGADRFSTFEALLFLLEALGQNHLADRLREQFELHVYAGLCSRGRKAEAAAYLATSPARLAFADFLAELARPRPNPDSQHAGNRPRRPDRPAPTDAPTEVHQSDAGSTTHS